LILVVVGPPADVRHACWVRPILAGRVSYTEWASPVRLRHPVWRGLQAQSGVIERDGGHLGAISVRGNLARELMVFSACSSG
jgi:hypothetical protein